MPDEIVATGLIAGGEDTWTLWVKIMATGATLALLLLAVFTLALYRHRDREAPVALHFTLANLFATAYVTGDIAVGIHLRQGQPDQVMLPYRLSLAAVVMALVAFICLQRVLRQRDTPAGPLLALYATGLLFSSLLWLRHPWLIIASDRFMVSGNGVFADYGTGAAPFFGVCLLLFAMASWRLLHRARRAGGVLVWRLTVFGFAIFFLAGVHDTLRELRVELLPFSALTLGCACFHLGAFAAMAIHYSRTLSERTQHSHQLQRLTDEANRDPLSGLFNRTYLENRLDHLGGAGGGLLFIDLDHFKLVNDRFGHGHGDRLIRLVAERLRSTMREGDIACRWGGDEFVVYLAEAHSNSAPPIVARLLAAFATIELDGVTGIDIGASMGFAELTDVDWRDTLKRADEALYRAKSEGRNRLSIA
ncbi:GGDEF domain-containing protein [Alloalcanivorax mobilis]|uniref:GGDEF domain-containing protein n=1 Tax=Alloalcanivorax mobilis TaxID=2019569 RepID=UPI000C775096|nr:GGDEF domain-containing protein [Alloalcanivorax mobilis]